MTKKKAVCLALLSIAGLLSSCVGSNASSSSSSNDEIKEVYEAYKANGGTLSYEEWLASIKGEKGDKGDKGDTGAQGEKGEKGDAGTNGKDGADGKDGKDGVNGQDGVDGVDGKDGSSLLTGEGEPASTLGSDGDSYIDTDTFDYYTKANGAWTKAGNIKGEKGEKGDTGATGAKGDTGAAGKDGTNGADGKDGAKGSDGSSVRTGKGEPASSLGNDGDSYIDLDTFDFYVKADGAWTKSGNIKGTKGDTGTAGETGATGATGAAGKDGTNGTNGKDGATILTGSSSPDDTQGKEGDVYIDTSTGDVYSKGESAWTKSGNIKGKQGVSITKTEIDDNGHLIITYSDDSTSDAGQVKDASVHTVTFHVDDEIVETMTVKDGEKVSAPEESKTAGYTIKSWNSKEDGGYRWLFSAYLVTSDLDLYADFDYNHYTITRHDEKYCTYFDAIDIAYDHDYSIANPAEQDGWNFAGWKDENGNSFDPNGTYRLTSDIALYASWTPVEGFMYLAGARGTIPYPGIYLTYGQHYELPTPTYQDHYFLGYYDGDTRISGSATYKGTGNPDDPYSATYDAKWTTEKDLYAFDAGDGTVSTDTMTLKEGKAYTLPTPTNDSKFSVGSANFTSYKFLGWYLDGEKVETSGDSWTAPTSSSRILMAKWEPQEVTYGYYPQTRIKDTEITDQLDALARSSSSMTANGWYHLNGKYYVKKEAHSYNYSESQAYVFTFDDGDRIESGNEYWFECEPITWKILTSKDGEYSLLSKTLLDTRCYDDASGDNLVSSQYDISSIRAWLNGEFYDNAFFFGGSLVQTTTVDNSRASTRNMESEVCEDTEDKVYLLSLADYTNEDYGYWSAFMYDDPSSSAFDPARQIKPTDWAKANGAYLLSYNPDNYGYACYWTRSPRGGTPWAVQEDGSINPWGASATDCCVRPGITIKVS